VPSATTNAESGTNNKNKNRKVGEATRYIHRNTFHGQATRGNKRRKLKKVLGGHSEKQ
jgi:1-aminocyclopropane-1-carboxylate deaminase/D-cysteine desulfhydrase-like pyridoxal-dependent ACC family enzyme